MRFGGIKIFVGVFLVFTLVFSFTLVSSGKEFYLLGQDLRLDLSEMDDYVLRVATPSKAFLKEGSRDVFLYNLDEVGRYSIRIDAVGYEEDYSFFVYESEEDLDWNVNSKGLGFMEVVDIEEELEKLDLSLENEEGLIDKGDELNPKEEFLSDDLRIEIGKPVLNVKKINSNGKRIRFEIPYVAENVTVDGEEVIVETSFVSRIASMVSESSANKEVVLESVVNETEVIYYTPAPKKDEKEISDRKKEVVISAPDYLGYENVLSYTNISEITGDKNDIRVFWEEEGRYLDFDVNDSDGNGFIDEVYWIVPHLSTQTFEIIVITKAEHLDENRGFIDDVYDEVSMIDDKGIYVRDGEYLRVVFERELDSSKDITIYSSSNDSAVVEVYVKDSDERIAIFENISNYGEYKVFLTELDSFEDTFDLKVLGNVYFDYVVDPSTKSIDSDSFEDQDWISDLGTNWQTSTTGGILDIDNERASDGSWSMRAGNGANTQQNATLAIDTTGYTNISVSFYYAETGNWEAADCYYFDWTSDGFSWNNELTLCNDFPNGATFTLAEYNLSSVADNNPNFSIRFIHDNPTSGDGEESWTDNIIVMGYGNAAPSNEAVNINSTDGSNLTSQDLNCFSTLIDSDGDSMNVSVRWYKNDVLNLSYDYNNTYSNNSFFVSTLLGGNTSIVENWSCSLRVTDGIDFSSWTSSSNLTIVDPGLPPNITIVSPLSASYDYSDIDINVSIDKNTDWCGYSLDGAVNVSMTKINNTFFTGLETLSAGTYDLEVYCNDTFGIYDYKNVTFLVNVPIYEKIGQWGVVEDIPAETWTTVYFDEEFDSVPVVVHQIDYGYDYDDNPCSTRVRAVTTSSFQIRTDSWSETASCPVTGIDGYWLAVRRGTYNVSNDGVPLREIEAANFTMDVDACGSGANPTDWTYSENHRYFQNSWSYQPLVLAAVQTANDVDPISQYIRGCTDTNSDTWNTTCVEIGLNGMENDGTIQPCNLHTIDEEGGYIAWEMNSDWSNSEALDNNGSTGDGVMGYGWEAYWESDSVQGSQNDPYPMSNYYVTLSQNFTQGIALGSGIRVDGANGVFPTVHFDAPDTRVYLLSDEDEFGDIEQQHTPEPYQLLFFHNTSGFLYSDNVLDILTVNSPINNSIYGSSTVDFDVSMLVDADFCWFSLDAGSNVTMDKVDANNFGYSQGGLSDTNHNIIFYCNDTFGGEYVSDLYNFSIDSTPLIVNATSPLVQSYNVTDFSFEVVSNKAVTWCSYSLNGASNVSMTEVNSTYFAATKNNLREGNYTIDYYCGGGGVSDHDFVDFSVDLDIEFNVSRGSVTLFDGSSEVNVSFTPQVVSKAFLLFSVRSANSGPSQIQVLGELMSDKINFRRYSTSGDTYIEWEVVESPDVYVQRDSVDFGTGSSLETGSIESVNLTESFAIVSGRLNTGTASQNVEGFWTVDYDSATQLGFSRGTTGSSGELHFQSVEWDDSFVQSDYLTGSGANFSDTLSSSVNVSRSFLLFSREVSGATNLEDTSFRGYFVGDDKVEFFKNGGAVSYGVSYFVVENNRFRTQTGETSVTGSAVVNATINSVNLSTSFNLGSWDSTGGGTTFSNRFLTHKIGNETTLNFQKETASQTQVVNWFVIEVGEPVLDFMNVISPVSQSYSTTTIDFNVSLTQNGSWCGYSLDGAANITMTSLNETYFYNTEIGLVSTDHWVVFYCNDTSGKMYNSQNVTFDIDMSPPNVISMNPPNSTTNTTNTLLFQYNVTDNAGVDSCSLIADEVVIWTDSSIMMDVVQEFEVYLDNGIYDWYVNCSDGGGLTSSSEVREINVSGSDVYTWENRFYETSTVNFSSVADIDLVTSRDSVENELSMNLTASQVTTVGIMKSNYLGNGGAIIPASTIVDFSAYTTVSTNNVGYLTWKLYIENSSGDYFVCQSGDDSTAGTRMSSAAATWAGTCNSPAYDWVLKKSDRIKVVFNVYNDDTSNLTFTHVWDDLKLSYVDFFEFDVLGGLIVDLIYPENDTAVDRASDINVTCEASCNTGSCFNTNVYLERYNGTDWVNVGGSGGIILGIGESNPHSLGEVTTTPVETNFTLEGNLVSFNDLRCVGTSTYSDYTGQTVRNIEVSDTNLPPTVVLINPAAGNWFNTSQVELFYNATDLNDNIANTTLILNGFVNETNSSVVVSGALSNFTISLADGSYNWTVNVTDTDGETGTDVTVRTFYVDTGLPQVELFNPLVDENLSSVLVDFNFSIIDNMDSVLSCDLILDGAVEESGITANNGTYVNTSVIVGLGDHLWNVSCVDEAGNVNFSETRNFSINDFPPTVELLTSDSIWFNESSFTLEYNVTDNNDILNCSIYIDGIFNKSNESEISMGAVSEFNLTGMNEGIYNWSVLCFDDAELSSWSSNRTIYVDLNAPSVNLNLPNHLFTSPIADVNFNFTAIDSLDSDLTCNLIVGGVTYFSDFSALNDTLENNLVLNLPDGSLSWNVTCWDDANNTQTSGSRIITIEEYPEVFLNTSNNSWFYPDLEFDYTPIDNTNFSNCSLYLNGALNKSNSTVVVNGAINQFTVDSLSDAKYNWSVECTDLYGLKTVASETRVAYVDGTKPSVDLIYPIDGENVFSGDINFNITASDNLATNITCNLTVDGSVVDSGFSFLSGDWVNRTNLVVPGTHYWNATCWDEFGNVNTSSTWNFTNYEAPSVSLDSPENNTWLNYTDVLLEYNIFDSDNNVKNCSLFVDGVFDQGNYTPIDNGAVNNFSKILSEGYHNWTVICYDYTGLAGTDDYRNVNIDVNVPNVILNDPDHESIEDWNNVTFNFTGFDNLDSVLSCDLIIDAFPEVTGINASNSSDVLVYVMRNDGDYDWQVTCYDDANNSFTTPLLNFTVDAPPKVTLNSPPNGNFTTDSILYFNYTPEDAAGIVQCEYLLDGVVNNTETTIFANQPNVFNFTGISEGVHNWTVRCLDADSNWGNTSTFYFTRDVTAPLVILESPSEDANLDANNPTVNFRWHIEDALSGYGYCELFVDGVSRRSNIFVTNGTAKTEGVVGLGQGPHDWNVTCVDRVDNSGDSETRNFTYYFPDFTVLNFTLNSSTLVEGETVFLNATIKNIGGADVSGVDVEFYLGNPALNNVIENYSINLDVNETVAVNTTHVVDIGLSEFWIVVDYGNSFTEDSEVNNDLNENVSVGAWHYFYGHVNPDSEYVLGTDVGTVVVWNVTDFSNGNIYVADKEGSISWTDLNPLGRDKSYVEQIDDFSEADGLLNMTGFGDSIEALYLDGGAVNRTDNFTVFKRDVDYVPVAISISSGNFDTGILWDTFDSADSEYDSAEREDLVFVTKINEDVVGSYETVDYEMRVPARLREYSGSNSEAVFYVELE
jgi:hypothetical protein